ncbi:tRNA methyltransferase 10 homolog A isoform X2 [Planococcus citri]
MSGILPSLSDSADDAASTDKTIKNEFPEESSLIVNDLSKEEYSDLVIPDDHKFDSIMPDEMEAEEKGPSKKALKKERKLQRYMDMKAARKARRKEKRKDRQERIKLGILNTSKSTKKVYSMSESKSKHTVVLDLSFGDYMTERDMSKCSNQIARTYSANRRSPNPVQLHLCSFNDKIKEELIKIDGMDKWDVHIHEHKYLLYFEREKIVYLTSDSENVLENVEEDKIYVIGGFVDHNLHKGLSLKKARADGIRHARLPLQQNIVLNSRTVLAINHVFEILLAKANGASWREAFRTAIPQRKIGTPNPRRVKQVGEVQKLCKGEPGDEKLCEDKPGMEKS